MKRREVLKGSAAIAGLLLPQALVANVRPCAPPSVRVRGGSEVVTACSDTVLQTVVEGLRAASPSAPAWSEVDVGAESLNAKVHFWGEPAPGEEVAGGRPPFSAPNHVSDEYNILDWPGKAHWDDVAGDWWFSGGPTGNQGSASPTIVRYRPADDRFTHWQGRAVGQGGIWPPNGHAHSFDAADLDVKGRKIWRHLVPHSSQPWGFRLGWFNIDTHESGQFSEGGWDGTYPTISFMPDNRLLHVIRGQPGGAANIRRFSVDNMAWAMESLKGPMGRAGPSCYFRGAIYCTTDQSHFFAVQPDGTVKARASTPIIMDRAIENTITYSILCPVGEHIYAFCGNGDIWRYDPNADRWGDRPYDAIPWLWPHDTLSAIGWHYLKQACVGPVSSLGVAMLCSARRVTRQGVSPSRALIWKP